MLGLEEIFSSDVAYLFGCVLCCSNYRFPIRPSAGTISKVNPFLVVSTRLKVDLELSSPVRSVV